MKKQTNAWVQVAVTFLLVLIPALVMWIFLSRDWNRQPPLALGYVALIALAYLVVSFGLVCLLIKLRVCGYDILNFTIPISLILIVILLTATMPIWARALIVFGLVLSAWPINILVTKYTDFQAAKTARIQKIMVQKQKEQENKA